MYSNIVLSGGALKIFALIGALKHIENKYKSFNKFKNFLGCSAGSLLCLYLCLDYHIDDIYQDLKNQYSTTQINSSIKLNNILNFFEHMGLMDNIFIEQIVEKLLVLRFHKNDITFIEFAKLTGKNIIINGSNISTKNEEFFCIDNYPDMSIKTAIKISMCYPFIFKPILFNDSLYIDGGLYNNFPIHYFGLNTLETIGINLVSTKNEEINNFSNYCKAIINSVLEKLTISSNKTIVCDNICNINIVNNYEFFSFKKLEFTMDDKIADEYYNEGLNQIKLYMKDKQKKNRKSADKHDGKKIIA